MIRLTENYNNIVVPKMMEKFGYKSRMAVPKIEKTVVNVGFGKLVSTKTSDEKKKVINSVLNDLALITGQRPVVTKARKSIAGFKIRIGSEIGCAVTLRRKKMFDFLERLINITLPRSRDFSGIKQGSFDKSGNLTIAIKEHISFPEILPEKAKTIFSLEITVVTTTNKKEEAFEFLKLMGFPLKQN